MVPSDSCTGVDGAVCAVTASRVDYQDGASHLFPDYWEDFVQPIPAAERGDMIKADYQRLTGPNELAKMQTAKAWSVWEGRCAYRYAVEVTVYLSPNAVSQGLGSRLYTELFAQLRAKSMHVAMGGIALPNPASIALHEKFGMKKVAHFEQVGFKFDQWVDVGYWQIIFK